METIDSAPWRKSTYSGTNGGDCVEAAWEAAFWSATPPTVSARS